MFVGSLLWGVEGREFIKGMDRLSKRSWQLSDLSGRSAMLAQGGCMQEKKSPEGLLASQNATYVAPLRKGHFWLKPYFDLQ